MSHFIEGERIYLRGVELSDVTDRYVAWMNDSDISQFMETWHFPHTRINIEGYVRVHEDNRNEPFFAIILKRKSDANISPYPTYVNPERHIGNIKLGPVNWVHRFSDISLFIGEKDLWGQGYATEAIKLITDYAFKRLNLHKVKAGIYCRNVASINAFKKAGFEFESELRNHVFFNGEYISIYIMGKINE